MTELKLNPVCSEKLICLPFSIMGFNIAVTIKPKDKMNLYVKFQSPFYNYEGDLPKHRIVNFVETLNKFIHDE